MQRAKREERQCKDGGKSDEEKGEEEDTENVIIAIAFGRIAESEPMKQPTWGFGMAH